MCYLQVGVDAELSAVAALIGRKDGQNRRKNFRPKQRTRLARKAVNARWRRARRAVHGWLVPVMYQGKVRGYRRKYSDRLLMALLKVRKPEIYGVANQS